MPPAVTRFAPSPTGPLHLGSVHAALFARRHGARYLVRLEDIDTGRCRPEFAAAILDDLAWLGLAGDGPVRRQSAHLATYRAALDRLAGLGLLYPCFCTRAAIAAEVAAIGGAPHGEDGPLYPGTCRALSPAEREERIAAGEEHALRLDLAAACRLAGPLAWTDLDHGRIACEPGRFGDVVLARKGTPTSYHLCVTIDDALQGVTLVTRAEDLFQASHLHRLLQALLDLPVPRWRHHRLLTGPDGRRYAKRDRAVGIAALRAQGLSPEQVIARAAG